MRNSIFVFVIIMIIISCSTVFAVEEPPQSKQLTFFKAYCSYMGTKHYSRNTILSMVVAFPIDIPSGNFYKGEPTGISNTWKEQICMNHANHSGHNWALWNVKAIKAAQALSPDDESLLHYSGCLSDDDFSRYFKQSGLCDYIKGGEQFAKGRGLPIANANNSHAQVTTDTSDYNHRSEGYSSAAQDAATSLLAAVSLYAACKTTSLAVIAVGETFPLTLWDDNHHPMDKQHLSGVMSNMAPGFELSCSVSRKFGGTNRQFAQNARDSIRDIKFTENQKQKLRTACSNGSGAAVYYMRELRVCNMF